MKGLPCAFLRQLCCAVTFQLPLHAAETLRSGTRARPDAGEAAGTFSFCGGGLRACVRAPSRVGEGRMFTVKTGAEDFSVSDERSNGTQRVRPSVQRVTARGRVTHQVVSSRSMEHAPKLTFSLLTRGYIHCQRRQK